MGPPDSRRHFTLTVLESVPRVSSKDNDDTSTIPYTKLRITTLLTPRFTALH
jgi:hypothetical protein